jgi:spermidine synthase
VSGQCDWISETLHNDKGVQTFYKAFRMLHEEHTGHQHLALFEHPHYGKVLMLDGAVQVTSGDEFVYHEMMSHVPLMAHDNPTDVLIIGGGDCGIAKEAIRHRNVRRIVQVEIDRRVVEFSREHFPEFAGPAFADPRFEPVIMDGMEYLSKAHSEEFDVILVDSTDPQGPGEVLFSFEFYGACLRALKRGGILVTQNGVPFFQEKELASSLGHFSRLFGHSGCYVAAIPTYVGGHMAMGWASDRFIPAVSADMLDGRYTLAGRFKTKYWTPRVQCAAFALPRFIEDIVERAGA